MWRGPSRPPDATCLPRGATCAPQVYSGTMAQLWARLLARGPCLDGLGGGRDRTEQYLWPFRSGAETTPGTPVFAPLPYTPSFATQTPPGPHRLALECPSPTSYPPSSLTPCSRLSSQSTSFEESSLVSWAVSASPPPSLLLPLPLSICPFLLPSPSAPLSLPPSLHLSFPLFLPLSNHHPPNSRSPLFPPDDLYLAAANKSSLYSCLNSSHGSPG